MAKITIDLKSKFIHLKKLRRRLKNKKNRYQRMLDAMVSKADTYMTELIDEETAKFTAAISKRREALR